MTDSADDHKERIKRRMECWLTAIRDQGLPMTADQRIYLEVAATLIGVTKGHLANTISQGRGPPTFSLGGGGRKLSIDVADLSSWVEDRRHE